MPITATLVAVLSLGLAIGATTALFRAKFDGKALVDALIDADARSWLTFRGCTRHSPGMPRGMS